MTGGFRDTLSRIAAIATAFAEPWWIIGSAAVVLHGGETAVADIDVLCGEADAVALIAALGGERLGTDADPLFRSAVFGRCDATPLPVEVMAGFAVRGEPVRLVTREWRPYGSVAVAVPSRVELVTLLRRFGRDKDLARAALLEG